MHWPMWSSGAVYVMLTMPIMNDPRSRDCFLCYSEPPSCYSYGTSSPFQFARRGFQGRKKGRPALTFSFSGERHAEFAAMSKQSIMDRVTAAKHSLAGQGLAKVVCKATTEEVMGPKKKHLDCKYPCVWWIYIVHYYNTQSAGAYDNVMCVNAARELWRHISTPRQWRTRWHRVWVYTPLRQLSGSGVILVGCNR